MTWACIWTETNGEADFTLRRVRLDDKSPPVCTVGTYHQANVVIGREPVRMGEDFSIAAIEPEGYAADQRWPRACACGYEFRADDLFQVNQEPIYVELATGRTWPQRGLPVGAMFDAPWYRPWGIGADGIALMVVLPPESEDARSNFWHVDGPARSREPGGESTVTPNAWSRTGDPRNPSTLTVQPSILTDRYHGFLQSGVLTDPL